MRATFRLVAAATVVGALVTGLTASTASADRGNGNRFDHIFVIMMENHTTSQIIGNTADAPYINALAAESGVALNYLGVTHPSLPNYLAAISGNFQGIWDDCKAGATVTCAPEEFGPDSGYTNGQELLTPEQIASATATPHMFSGQTIVDQLEAHGLSWKAYMQSMPSVGYPGEYSPVEANGTVVKLYAQKHNPFMYFSSIVSDPQRLAKIVPFTRFGLDLATNSVPNFVWISPDQCNDMHSISATGAAIIGNPECVAPATGLDHTVIQEGDDFVQATVSEIEASQAWSENSAIVLVWDENDYTGHAGCCHSPTGVGGAVLGGDSAPFLVVTSKHRRPFVDATTPYNHYSLLATIEQLWGLGCLDQACGFSSQELMTQFFTGAQ
jgi:hypothetical protein